MLNSNSYTIKKSQPRVDRICVRLLPGLYVLRSIQMAKIYLSDVSIIKANAVNSDLAGTGAYNEEGTG